MTKINYLSCSFFICIYIFFSILTGCSTTKNIVQEQPVIENYVYPEVSSLKLTFANLETPVVNYLDYENYPNFNVKNAY
ncbi:MAG: hypothetical protein II232_05285, partial [Spirochaetaceae bacterium]|nr:hypothetical protein [Spirochaetaceae bacterium]